MTLDFSHPLEERLRSRIDQLREEIAILEGKVDRLEREKVRLKNYQLSHLRFRCVWCGAPVDGKNSHAQCRRWEKDLQAAYR